MSKTKKVLIISFFFPPSRRVGGRRWAKLAKYMVRHGIEVHVVAVETHEPKEDPWGEDINDFSDSVTYIPFIRPPYYRTNMAPKSIAGKIKYRFSKAITKNRLKGYKGDNGD
ncbi:MAG: hypothetical protein HRU15_11780, partial [Planctomycetes bacterium]|nr:hypothetical protein [Planctomycetota bacterium]